MGIELIVRVLDEKGKVIKEKKLPLSYVIAFLRHVYVWTSDTGLVDSLATDGTTQEIYGYPPCGKLDAGAGVDDYGVVVGTGTLTPDNEDYKLEAQILEGVGAGQLQHGGVSFVAPAVVGANVDYRVSRTFTNGSGADITVNEVGLVARTRDYSNVIHYFLIARDLLTFTVPVGLSRTVEYILRTTA